MTMVIDGTNGVTFPNTTVQTVAALPLTGGQLSGNLTFATGTNGIIFNNSGATTNSTLNDYETGTWTPTLNSQSGGSASLSVTYASYTKIGRMVYCSINISTTSSFSGSTSYVYIGGLPFATNTNGSARYSGIVDYNTAFQTVCGILVFNIGGGTGSAEAFFNASDASSSTTTFSTGVTTGAYLGSGKIIQGSFSYEASF